MALLVVELNTSFAGRITNGDYELQAVHSRLPDTNWNCGFNVAAGIGIHGFGSVQSHDLALASVHVGRFLNLDSSRWATQLRHFELAGEFWTGAQFHPDSAYLAGLTPFLRYHFRPQARWTPFLDLGSGIMATDIGNPDLSTTFQFNSQAGIGMHWKIRPDLAFTTVARFIHISNAGIDHPNNGANTVMLSIGLTWFFRDGAW